MSTTIPVPQSAQERQQVSIDKGFALRQGVSVDKAAFTKAYNEVIPSPGIEMDYGKVFSDLQKRREAATGADKVLIEDLMVTFELRAQLNEAKNKQKELTISAYANLLVSAHSAAGTFDKAAEAAAKKAAEEKAKEVPQTSAGRREKSIEYAFEHKKSNADRATFEHLYDEVEKAGTVAGVVNYPKLYKVLEKKRDHTDEKNLVQDVMVAFKLRQTFAATKLTSMDMPSYETLLLGANDAITDVQKAVPATAQQRADAGLEFALEHGKAKNKAGVEAIFDMTEVQARSNGMTDFDKAYSSLSKQLASAKKDKNTEAQSEIEDVMAGFALRQKFATALKKGALDEVPNYSSLLSDAKDQASGADKRLEDKAKKFHEKEDAAHRTPMEQAIYERLTAKGQNTDLTHSVDGRIQDLLKQGGVSGASTLDKKIYFEQHPSVTVGIAGLLSSDVATILDRADAIAAERAKAAAQPAPAQPTQPTPAQPAPAQPAPTQPAKQPAAKATPHQGGASGDTHHASAPIVKDPAPPQALDDNAFITAMLVDGACLQKEEKGKYGQDKALVEAVQKSVLRINGSLAWGADGKFGDATEKSVIDIQKAYKITASGEVDATTLAAFQVAELKAVVDKLAAGKGATDDQKATIASELQDIVSVKDKLPPEALKVLGEVMKSIDTNIKVGQAAGDVLNQAIADVRTKVPGISQ